VKKILTSVVLMCAGVWAAERFTPLNVKTGLWESTTTTTMNGQLPLSDELLAKLTPEQRARFEARLKANSPDKTRTFTTRNCMTKEKLERGLFGPNEKECTETVLNSTSSKLEVRLTCQSEGMKSEGTMLIEALGSESAKGSGNMTVNGGGHTMTSKTSFSAKWLGPSCGNVK
jgi:uncharacterized protein DUF3617